MVSILPFLGRDFLGNQPVSPGGAVSWVRTPGILAGLPTGAVVGGRITFRKVFSLIRRVGLHLSLYNCFSAIPFAWRELVSG